MKHKAKKISAVILSAVLAASSFSSIPAYADGETVQISSAEDFAAFSKNCTLDSWSRGKTINLTADISLADTDISPVPIFCGTFNGNGHTISGLDLDGGNSYQGLFRFVAEDGVINGLTVSGTVSADGAQEYVGGIAGSVRGIVRDCSFEGVIDGTMYVGGIAGITEKTGRIENCRGHRHGPGRKIHRGHHRTERRLHFRLCKPCTDQSLARRNSAPVWRKRHRLM